MADMMMDIAEDAGDELMKEKIKAHFEKIAGAKWDKAAKIIAEHTLAVWKAEMENKVMEEKESKEFEEKLNAVFSSK